ncbi:MAG: calcineurin-like phosphoesterase C-terminal domain-containing protein [Candidatus Sumerlaeales bacterium]|nr:calcineurin-like phosphoesterase C-terminal domain-containing protein [Candidatus Sumerlaeales bacterium]
MPKKSLLTACLWALFASCLWSAELTGVVYEDVNANGVRDEGEPGISGVAVNTAQGVEMTDEDGNYTLNWIGMGKLIVWVRVPAEYTVARDKMTNVPQFYKVFYSESDNAFLKTNEPGESVDFALLKRPASESGDAFKMLVLSDPQVGDTHQVELYREDILCELVGTDAEFAVCLGDFGGGPKFIRNIADATGMLGIPVYGAIGNHDRVETTDNRDSFDDGFNAVYGPSDYSFDRGKAHFIVLSTTYFTGKGSGYKEGLTEEQLSWVKQDLESVPAEKLIVFMSHCPLYDRKGVPQLNIDKLLALLDGRKVMSFAGHWHTNSRMDLITSENATTTGPRELVQQVCPVACGSFWCGPADLRGIPVSDQPDGTPNGYTIWQFDGDKMPVGRYKAASLPESYQMRILTPDLLGGGYYWNGNGMLVNYFMGYDKSKVEYRLNGGEWIAMTRKEMVDPETAQLIDGVAAHRWVPTLWVEPSKHIWFTDTLVGLKTGMNTVLIRATEPDGRVIEQGRIFRGYKKAD